MQFEPNTIYHIYNQGNNRQQIFYSEKNYLFFLKKMRQYLLPYGDLLCYCLMPNHFHWLMYVRETALPVVSPDPQTVKTEAYRPLNNSIGILLSSYTRAINKQERRTGALFREETKAKNGWSNPYLFIGDPANNAVPQNWDLYGITCFNYIHNNPVRPGLVKCAEAWEYSSARDYAGLRNGTICNKALANELWGV